MVVPGVPAALAADASLGRTLTRRGIARTVTFLTPRVGRGESASTWLPAAMGADTVVLYMAAGASREVAAAMIEAGKPPPPPAPSSKTRRCPRNVVALRQSGGSPATKPSAPAGPVACAAAEGSGKPS